MMANLKKIFIVDDEILACKSLVKLVEHYCSDASVIGFAQSVEDAKEKIPLLQPDILLLDIRLGGKTGFDLLSDLIDTNFHVIFTTAYDNYALKAFKFNAIDYLLKPIDPTELKEAIAKVKVNALSEYQNKIDKLLLELHKSKPKKIIINGNKGKEFISLADINFIKSEGGYTTIYTDTKNILVAKTLLDFENTLPKTSFFRTHQSYIVNIDKIATIEKETSSVIMENNETIIVSRRKKEQFMLFISNNYIS